jgi:co-chaperonin GroES (HSP10)
MKSDSSIPIISGRPKGEVKWEPMPGKIICRVVGDTETFGGGKIFKPVTHRQPRTTAEVIAVYEPFLLDNANEKSETSAYVEVGDIVLFGMHSGIEIEYGDQKVIILREQEILTKVKLVNPDDVQHIGLAAQGPLDDVEG